MKNVVPFHFVMLAAGEVLKVNHTVTAEDVQNYIANDTAFEGVRPPLEDCRLMLSLMRDSALLEEVIPGTYAKDRKHV